MAVTISGSVGAGGKNNMADVFAIQNLLNKWTTPPITVNGICDGTATDPTVAAIRNFQSRYTRNPDGRVDPGGGTLGRLNRDPLVQLPTAIAGSGYYSYSAASRQWGTRATIDALVELGRLFLAANPTRLMGIGDISFEFGGPMSPHSSHQAGRHIDLRPLRIDNAQVRVDYFDTTNYDQDGTKALIELFLTHRNVSTILFNDPIINALARVSPYRNHDNHFHVSMLA